MAAAYPVDPESYLWKTCPKHLSTSCVTCPRCFHGRFRCQYCFRTKGGTASPRRRHRLRCPCCGRFKALAVQTSECDRCTSSGFVALTLF